MDCVLKHPHSLLHVQLRLADNPGVGVCNLIDLIVESIVETHLDFRDAATASRVSHDAHLIEA